MEVNMYLQLFLISIKHITGIKLENLNSFTPHLYIFAIYSHLIVIQRNNSTIKENPFLIYFQTEGLGQTDFFVEHFTYTTSIKLMNYFEIRYELLLVAI